MTELLTANQILDKMRARLEKLVDKKIDYNPEKYQTCWALSGAGIGAGEWEYDEIKAREDLIDDEDWFEDEEMTELIGELLWVL